MQLVYILLAVETQSHYVIACLLACLAGSPPLSLGIEIKMIYLSLIVFAIQESLFLSLSLSRECNNWYLNREHMRFALRFSRKMIYFKKKKSISFLRQICHAGRQIEGHPRTSIPNISALIEEAYENHELLRPEKWSKLHDNGGQVTRPVQRDISRQTYSPVTSVSLESQYTRRKLLGGTFRRVKIF